MPFGQHSRVSDTRWFPHLKILPNKGIEMGSDFNLICIMRFYVLFPDGKMPFGQQELETAINILVLLSTGDIRNLIMLR